MEYTHFVRAGIVMAAYDEARQKDQNTALLSDDILLGDVCIPSSRLPPHEAVFGSIRFFPEHTTSKLKAELSQTFSLCTRTEKLCR